MERSRIMSYLINSSGVSDTSGVSSKINWYPNKVGLILQNTRSKFDSVEMRKVQLKRLWGASRNITSNGVPVTEIRLTLYPALVAILVKLLRVKNLKWV